MQHLSQAIIFSHGVCSESGPVDSFILQQFFLMFSYVFGCARSQLWHMGSSISVAGVIFFVLVAAFRIFSCGMWDLVP